MAALTSSQKELLAIVLSYAAGSDNDSVIDNAVTQVLKEQKVPGYWGHLKWLLTRRALAANRRLKKEGARPKLVLT